MNPRLVQTCPLVDNFCAHVLPGPSHLAGRHSGVQPLALWAGMAELESGQLLPGDASNCTRLPCRGPMPLKTLELPLAPEHQCR